MISKECLWLKRSRDPESELHVAVLSPGGSHAAVFVHGFTGHAVENHGLFRRLAESLAVRGRSAFLFDQLGCGYSDGSYVDVTVEDIESDILDVYDYCRSKFGKVSVIAQSLGSSVLLKLLGEQKVHPEAIVALNPVGDFFRWMPERFGWPTKRPAGEPLLTRPKGIYVGSRLVEQLYDWKWDWPSIDSNSEPNYVLVFSGSDEFGSDRIAGAAQDFTQLEVRTIQGANHSFTGQPDLEEEFARTVHEVIFSR